MSIIDFLPSYEKTKRRARMRSPEEYERIREKVKSPEKIAEEMDKNEHLAELNFALETEPKMRQALQEQIREDISAQGLENLVERFEELSENEKQSIDQGQFDVGIDSYTEDQSDRVTLYPEGNVNEKVPLTKKQSEHYAQQLSSDALHLVTIMVTVDNEVCAYMDVSSDVDEEVLVEIARDDPGVQQCLNGKQIVQAHYEPGTALHLISSAN